MSLKTYLSDFFDNHRDELIIGALNAVKLNDANIDPELDSVIIRIEIQIPVPANVLAQRSRRPARKRQPA